MNFEGMSAELDDIYLETKVDFEYFQKFGGSADDEYFTNRLHLLQEAIEAVYRLQQLEK